jgi:transcription-repair coupling factor (superfamily II helicase)
LNYIHKIQPYTASEGITPKITKLGSGEWLRKKNRTKSKLKDIARDLIRLYAERKLQEGISYPSDTIWQKELEASFVYEDTPDQALTTQDVKNDMERPTPMDRLVCGDVGFGKTEVAIRAAFKAAQSGKQVAVLVPTTILAQQHYMTFTDRLKNYPIITEILSRFKNKSEQRKILDKLERGSIDIIIGTHRLLSEDVKFKDLGLLIIDEEHRFGVGAKEKLRRLRSNVDTLAMTATPIPRTLNFSMIGARDISNIETPPRNRLPVYTEILEWNLELIKAFIEKEISRGGQVFFVNDNIEGLEKIGRDIKMLIPGLKVGIAHGQMKTRELEDVMSRFISGKYEVLVTTKIIESGIDIPNANTMIINRADNFGLAELYQLRGRVGRTNKQAYCYLIIPQMKRLSGKTLRRLQAIEEFTELGSGFRLALRDLEIRGAGNLLGPEQSGYINEIGFDLYHKILDEALQELRFEEFGELFDLESHKRAIAISNDDVEIDLAGVAMFPESYIKSESERFYYYKRLYEMRTNEDLYQIVDEITDKYGALPDEARELIYAVKVRMAALDTGLRKVIIKGENLIAEFPQSDNKEFYEMTLPVIIEFINDSEICKLKQIKKKVFLEARINNRDEAIELLWRLKRTISIN